MTGLSPSGRVATNANSETEPCACRRLRRGAVAQKKRLHPKMEPIDWAEAKSEVVANGRGRRIRHSPVGIAEGGGFDAARVSQTWTEGGGYGASHIDQANMDFDHLVSNAPADMSAMRLAQVRSALLPYDHGAVRKRYGPALGELRGQVTGGNPPAVHRQRREGGTPAIVDWVCRVCPGRFKGAWGSVHEGREQGGPQIAIGRVN